MIDKILDSCLITNELKQIARKVFGGERLTEDDGLKLFECKDLSFLGTLASFKKRQVSGNKVYYNRNFHIEPTNICIYACKFCSYRRSPGQEGAWDYSLDEMLDLCRKYEGTGVSEVHIVGGVHPKRDLHFYGILIQEIKKILPGIHVKAFTAVELDYMIKKSGYSLPEGLLKLKEYGLDSIPGGGAEIFDEKVRKEVCGDKSSSQMWLDIHQAAHQAGIPSNCTILYGHIETYAHRIDHLKRLRDLQDQTGGFNAFIPLKYKNANNSMGHLGEISTLEVLKNFAVTRLFLDNIPHLKAYWPMLGKDVAQMALTFGADDVDGTIDDSTKIYSMAGSEETKPIMTSKGMCALIKAVGYEPIERDSVYNEVKTVEYLKGE